MRDDLTQLLYDRTRDEVEYVFGNSVAALREDDGVWTSIRAWRVAAFGPGGRRRRAALDGAPARVWA